MKLSHILGFHSLIILLSARLASSAELWLFCGSYDNYTSTELDNPLPLLTNTCFNNALRSVIYAFGYSTTPADDITKIVINGYLQAGEINTFLLNWEKEANSGDSVIGYVLKYPTTAVPNAIKVGKTCGIALDIMSDSTLNLETTHLLGHSLGAHLVGFCGTELQSYDKIVGRVTGMDPAGPGFAGPISLHGITETCGTFVDAYHTDPGVFGIDEPVAQLDVWFNCDDKYQPKCENVTLLGKDSCSHLSINYYVAEMIVNPTAFVASTADSCSKWKSQNTTSDLIYVGEDTDPLARGNAYLRTNALSSYAMGLDGAVAST
ncbi:phospholipase A1-like isoform X2 [Aricia agestis]|uniref:phospholipase A1-like isoform X2 n=1 Tax=Aricia agestis TaxID=91739 RepID=UPI001C20A3C8|nr:phospholipase A1-like isoform X2 [Aricia agestis]